MEENGHSEIWQFERGFYKGYTEDVKVANRIIRWSSVERGSIYYTPSMRIFAYDFIFPTRSYNRVARALGLPERKKSAGRIKQGQRLHEVDRIAQVNSSKLAPVED